MSSTNFINNALSQLFVDIEDKCNVQFNSFTANDRPQRNGINADQEYMKMYQAEEDNRIFKYLYDPDLNFDFRFHQRMARINFGKRNMPWCCLMFNTDTVQPLTNILSHVYTGMKFVETDEVDTDGIPKQKAIEYTFRRVLCPVNFVLVSTELSYLYQIQEKMAMYFDRWINYTYSQQLCWDENPEHDDHFGLVGACQNIRQVNLDKLDTESKGSLAMVAYSFELIYYVVTTTNNEYNLLERIIVEVKEARHGQPLFVSVYE